MKKIMKKVLAIGMILLMVAVVFAAVPMNAGAGAPDKEVPFNGHFDGSTVASDPTDDVEVIEMSGKASHLGKYTAVVEADMVLGLNIYDFSGYPLVLATLSTTTTFTAANGDELYAVLVLDGVLNLAEGVENFPSFELSGTITGGTGRFAGATGSFTGSGGQTTVEGPDNDLISGTFSGSISTVGSNK